VDVAATFRENPPRFARSLFVILKDKELLELDPKETLMHALQTHEQLRLANAKLITAETPYLATVAPAAVKRFLELVSATSVPCGKRDYEQQSVLQKPWLKPISCSDFSAHLCTKQEKSKNV
jgi:hypothetical protein